MIGWGMSKNFFNVFQSKFKKNMSLNSNEVCIDRKREFIQEAKHRFLEKTEVCSILLQNKMSKIKYFLF